MKRVLAVAAGFAGGVLLAGIVTAALVPLLPDSLRGAYALWSVAAVVVGASVWAAWTASAARRE